jgi:hypothetical protein
MRSLPVAAAKTFLATVPWLVVAALHGCSNARGGRPEQGTKMDAPR